jgi:hypothetical protein
VTCCLFCSGGSVIRALSKASAGATRHRPHRRRAAPGSCRPGPRVSARVAAAPGYKVLAPLRFPFPMVVNEVLSANAIHTFIWGVITLQHDRPASGQRGGLREDTPPLRSPDTRALVRSHGAGASPRSVSRRRFANERSLGPPKEWTRDGRDSAVDTGRASWRSIRTRVWPATRNAAFTRANFPCNSAREDCCNTRLRARAQTIPKQ